MRWPRVTDLKTPTQSRAGTQSQLEQSDDAPS